MSSKKIRLIGLSLVLLSTFIVYSATLSFQFVWDDQKFILDWQTPKLGARGLIPLLLGDAPPGHEGVYRPLRGLYYLLAFQLFGLDPFWYHLSALITHLTATCLVYLLAKTILHHPGAALVTALTFGLHPLHLSSIAWITSSFDIIGQTLIFAALYRYLIWTRHKTSLNYYLSLILSLLAIFSHETASILPLVIILADLTINRPNAPSSPTRPLIYLPFFTLLGCYWFVRLPLLHITNRQPFPFSNLSLTLWYMGKIAIKYLAQLILPLTSSINHYLDPGIQAHFWADINYFHPPPPPTLTDPLLIASWSAILVLIAFSLPCWRCSQPLSFCLLWFFISLLPVMQFFPINSLYQERYAYLASFSWCLFLGFMSRRLIFRPSSSRLTLPFFLFLSLLFSFYSHRTFTQSHIWRDDLTLWQYETKKNPYSNSNLTNLGNAYLKLNRPTEAIEAYIAAIKLNPSQAVNFTNLGILQYQHQDRQGALTSLTQAITLKPPSLMAYLYLGIIYHQNQDYHQAESYYLTFRSAYPRYPDTYLYLGMLAHEQRQFDQAKNYYLQAISLKPQYADAYNNLGNLYKDTQAYPEAVKAYDAALKINPQHPYAGKNLTDLLKETGTAQSSP